eukprot:9211839-Pyramimonas_sp.AAC.1
MRAHCSASASRVSLRGDGLLGTTRFARSPASRRCERNSLNSDFKASRVPHLREVGTVNVLLTN